jgi:hypothetical protein
VNRLRHSTLLPKERAACTTHRRDVELVEDHRDTVQVSKSLRTEALLMLSCLTISRFDEPPLNSSLILATWQTCSAPEGGLPGPYTVRSPFATEESIDAINQQVHNVCLLKQVGSNGTQKACCFWYAKGVLFRAGGFVQLSRLTLASLAVGISATLLSAPLFGEKPTDVDTTPFTLDAGVACGFPVEIALQGKSKIIELPGGGSIITSPGQFATVKNVAAPSKQVTLNITGAFHNTPQADGSILTQYSGRNLILDVEAGFVLAIGNFSFVSDATGMIVLVPLRQQGGQLIDVCALIQ